MLINDIVNVRKIQDFLIVYNNSHYCLVLCVCNVFDPQSTFKKQNKTKKYIYFRRYFHISSEHTEYLRSSTCSPSRSREIYRRTDPGLISVII